MTNHATDRGRFGPPRAAVRKPVRETVLPPEGRAFWLSTERSAGELMYLSWGRRKYDLSPIRPTLHDGWVYVAVLQGNAVLETPDGPTKVRAGTMVRIGPDYVSGWSGGEKPGVVRQITWVWKSAPGGDSPPAAGSIGFARLSPEQGRELIHLHEACRREVARADAATFPILSHYRSILDLCFRRAAGRAAANGAGARAGTTGPRLELALSWVQANLAQPKPVEALAEYLQVSASTLERLFKSHFGIPPVKWLHQARMRKAECLKRDGRSMKEIAYALGYRFPNDFSRAWKRWNGRPSRPGPGLDPARRAASG